MTGSTPIKVYPADFSKKNTAPAPVYLIRDGGFYRTVDHTQGWSEHPDYKLKQDGKVYRTHYHPLGSSERPDFHFQQDGALYRTSDHPEGASSHPEYTVRD